MRLLVKRWVCHSSISLRCQQTLSSFSKGGIKKRARKFYEMLNFPADGGEAGAQFLRGFIKSARWGLLDKSGRRDRECLSTRRRHYCPPFKNRIVQNRRNTFPASYSSRAAGATRALARAASVREEGLSSSDTRGEVIKNRLRRGIEWNACQILSRVIIPSIAVQTLSYP